MFFIILTFCSALFIEGLGSLVSVIGISALFGANPIIIALAIALDVGKVVTVSLLYTYWKSLKTLMRTYALIAAAVTMTITSAGAAGYLSGEFQKAIMGTKEGELKVAVLKEQQAKYQLRKKQIDDQIAALPEKTTVNQRLRLMNGFKAEQQALDQKIAQIDQQLPQLQVAQIGTEAKAGPIVAIAKAFKVPVEQAVSWVIGMIITVFDPLAIFLIIAGNFLIARRKAEKEAKAEVADTAPAPEPTVITDGNITVPMRMGTEFPTHSKSGEYFYRTDLNQVYVFMDDKWKQLLRPTTRAAVKAAMEEKRGPRVVEAYESDVVKSWERPPETIYETYTPPVEPEPEPIPEPEPKPQPDPIPEPEPEPIVEEEKIEDRRTRVGTGILKPVDVALTDIDGKLDNSNFTPLTVPHREETPEKPREEITRSSLGLVPPDPYTIVDGRRNSGFIRPDSIPK
jgi:hypothetical protein